MNPPDPSEEAKTATPRTDEAFRKRPLNDFCGKPVVPADFARTLERENQSLRDEVERLRKGAPINTHVRLFDLVRYLRSDFHREGLITDEEYGWLCAISPMAISPKGGSPSRQRLEDYDELAANMKSLRKAAEAARVALDAIIKECYSEANRLANHGSNGLEKLVMTHLYDIANETKQALAALRAELRPDR